jgi:hypothetical protein
MHAPLFLLADDLLELLAVRLVAGKDVISLASSAKRWRAICQNAGLQSHWEAMCYQDFGWVGYKSWLCAPWYEIHVRRAWLDECPAVQPLERSSTVADTVQTFAEASFDPRISERRMNALQRARLWEPFTFAFELKYDGGAVAHWAGKYTEGYTYEDYHTGRGYADCVGMRLDVNLFDADDPPACFLNDDPESPIFGECLDMRDMLSRFWGQAGDAELSDHPAWAHRGPQSA